MLTKYKYSCNGNVGRIERDSFGKINRPSYSINGKSVPKIWAEVIFEAEKATPEKGRPKLYPMEKCELHGITMPDHLWRKLKKPYSSAVASLIKSYYRIK